MGRSAFVFRVTTMSPKLRPGHVRTALELEKLAGFDKPAISSMLSFSA
jgi:hypothetical protein